MKLIQQARFAAGPIRYYEPTATEGYGAVRADSVVRPATVEINGVVMSSPVPRSAAEAEKINRALEQAECPTTA